jgi:hypothetical protein
MRSKSRVSTLTTSSPEGTRGECPDPVENIPEGISAPNAAQQRHPLECSPSQRTAARIFAKGAADKADFTRDFAEITATNVVNGSA